ncbi:MAG: LCP family protein [Acutalibacteraceae bacterium]
MKKNERGYKLRTSLEFRTDKETKGRRRFTLGFFLLVGIIMLACVCTLLLLKEYDFDIDNIIGRSPETTDSTSQTNADMSLEGSSTFLFAVSDNSKNKLHYTALLNFDVSSGEIKIYTVDVNENHNEEKTKGNLTALYAKSDGSMLSLKEAVEEITGVTVSRYIHATDDSFKGLIKIFGGVPYDVKERVQYSCDGVGYIIEKGRQTLTADMSYKYMYYLSQQNADKPDEMSNFLSAVLKVILTPQNNSKADYYYSKLRNTLGTDISAFDYSNSKAALSQLVTLFESKDAVVVNSSKGF